MDNYFSPDADGARFPALHGPLAAGIHAAPTAAISFMIGRTSEHIDMNRTLAFAVVAALIPGAASAQINKCVDPSGKVVYSQSPCPPGQAAGVIRAPAPASHAEPTPAKPGAKAPPTPEEAFRQRQKEKSEAEQKAAKEAAAAKQQQEECQKARSVVAQYEMGGRVSGVKPNGERYFLDDSQIAQEKARAQQSVREWCK